MNIKKATYTQLDNTQITVEYDADAPCRVCGLPVVEASVGGTDLCPWCDSGLHRDGTKWTMADYKKMFGPPDYEKMKEDLRKWMAEQGKDLDELLKKAAVHFQGDKPPIRTSELTKEEIEAIIEEDKRLFQDGDMW